MNEQELINPAEEYPILSEDTEMGLTPYSPTFVQALFNERRSSLEPLKATLSLKFYNAISEKITAEEAQFNQLLHIEADKEKDNAQFSYILDTQYFEQKLLSTIL